MASIGYLKSICEEKLKSDEKKKKLSRYQFVFAKVIQFNNNKKFIFLSEFQYLDIYKNSHAPFFKKKKSAIACTYQIWSYIYGETSKIYKLSVNIYNISCG